jgi:hypothetical protein
MLRQHGEQHAATVMQIEQCMAEQCLPALSPADDTSQLLLPRSEDTGGVKQQRCCSPACSICSSIIERLQD